MITEMLVLLALILANGTFAMSEMAVVSARKIRLQQRAEEGDSGAQRALQLAEHPNRFLSTVQIGITLVGILAGAYGGATLATRFGGWLAQFPRIGPYGEEIALVLVVAAVTYLSLVIGELVPKRIALTHPERIASRVAGAMHGISVIATPAVKLLSASTDAILRLVRIRHGNEPPVTEEEIATLIEQGTRAGVFETQEREMVERVFWLADQNVGSLMTPRPRIVWLDADDTTGTNRKKLMQHRHSRFPVCERSADNIIGIVDVRDLLARSLTSGEFDIRSALLQPLYVPFALNALRLLDMFRESGMHFAVVIDEHGGVEGVITMNDVLEEISGDFIADQPRMVKRDASSWLVDGSMAMAAFTDELGVDEGWNHEPGSYHTVGGYVLTSLGHIPRAGESFEANGFRIEVVDMDGHRIDKLLVSRLPAADGTTTPV
jgi:putative hemolysin